jgi:hypothetical protein
MPIISIFVKHTNIIVPLAVNASCSPNELRFTGMGAVIGFDAFHLADMLLTQPLQIIVGSQ